jgi:hypothetical protein
MARKGGQTMRIGMLAFLGLLLTACAAQTPAFQVSAASSATTQTAMPPGARPDLDKKWVAQGRFVWPPDDGFTAPPTPLILPAGMLLDRFGDNYGQFLSPKGAGFPARALPYVCEAAAYKYSVYRVAAPLLVWAGKAKPWFDQQGGATQFETDAPVAMLLTDHVLEPVPASEKPCDRH